MTRSNDGCLRHGRVHGVEMGPQAKTIMQTTTGLDIAGLLSVRTQADTFAPGHYREISIE